jgi:carbonic anhydrase
MRTIPDLLERNRAWANACAQNDPQFFNRLCAIQRPDYLWIGCADSRVPANQILALEPGVLFVHRNIANIVVPGDPNCMAVVQYAIETLAVRHLIVCGHYGCGGVRAALDNEYGGSAHVERWLGPLRQLAVAHADSLSSLSTDEERWDRLCELNVIEQVRRLLSSDVLSAARLRGPSVSVSGLIYSLRDGLLQQLTTSASEPEAVVSRSHRP